MDTPFGFTTTPIKEIIFTLSFKEEIDESCINQFAEDPTISTHFNTNKQGQKLAAVEIKNQSIQGRTEKYRILETSQRDKILRIRRGAFALHKMDAHEKYESLLASLTDFWQKLQEKTTKNITIKEISLRYINFIELEGNEKIEALLNVYTSHPFPEEKIDRNFSQIQFSKPDKVHPTSIEVNLVTSTANHQGKKGVLLDIILNRKIGEQEEQHLEALFAGMRTIKNELFFKSITEKTKLKYT